MPPRSTLEAKVPRRQHTALGCFDVAIMRWADGSRDRPLAALIGEIFGSVQIPHTQPNS